MTYQEAIGIVNRRTTIPDDECTFEQINEAINLAISALEKQIPKNPTYKDVGDDGYKINTPFCFACDNPLFYMTIDTRANYCPRCGNAIDWSDEE